MGPSRSPGVHRCRLRGARSSRSRTASGPTTRGRRRTGGVHKGRIEMRPMAASSLRLIRSYKNMILNTIPKCSLYCYSNSAHISKLFTGFTLLRDAGAVTLSQECLIGRAFDASKPQHLRDAGLAHLLAVVDGITRLYYDNHDSGEIDVEAAEGVD